LNTSQKTRRASLLLVAIGAHLSLVNKHVIASVE
jgi:hypothetical protein